MREAPPERGGLLPLRLAEAAAAGVDAEAIRWVTKVLTVGGTLALSGGVAGAIIMAMASIVVYAVFAKAR